MSIRIGILGYGNLGRGVECAIKHNPDMELVGVFTRRAPESVKILTETAKVYSVDDAEKMKDQIDVMILDIAVIVCRRTPDAQSPQMVMQPPKAVLSHTNVRCFTSAVSISISRFNSLIRASFLVNYF